MIRVFIKSVHPSSLPSSLHFSTLPYFKQTIKVAFTQTQPDVANIFMCVTFP